MLKASAILGMQVISLYEGQVEGYVKNLIFSQDHKKLVKLIICSDKTEDKQYILKTKDIFKINDVIFIKNSTLISFAQNQEDNSPINLNAYLCDGVSLGKIIDIEIDEKFYVNKYVTSLSETCNSIAKINKHLVVFNTENSTLKTYLFKPRQSAITNTQSVTSSTKTVLTSNTINYNFLLGRKVCRDILTFNNQLLIKNGTLVTEKIVQIAKQNGKLRELALNI